jgi:hypothetical protein
MTKDPTMSEPNDRGMEFRAPPVDVPTSPVNRVIAVMDDPDEVASAIGHLVEVGYEREQIFVLCGPSGAERLDLSGRHHGGGVCTVSRSVSWPARSARSSNATPSTSREVGSSYPFRPTRRRRVRLRTSLPGTAVTR